MSTLLENLLKRLDNAQKTASIDPDEPAYAKTRGGIAVAVMQAKEDLTNLRNEYEKTVLQTGVAIFLFGQSDKTNEFAKLVSEMGEAVVIDASELYMSIAKQIEPSIGPSRNFTSEQVSALHTALSNVARDLGSYLLHPVSITRMEIVPDFHAVINCVRDTVRSNFGEEFNAMYLKRALGREGLKIRYMGSTSPVIILNALHEEAVGLGQIFGKGKATVEIQPDDIIDKEYIVKTFKNVQKQIKKK